jgi:hypothetical protein
MKSVIQAGRFLKGARKQLRHGEHSREELKLLRVQWNADAVECDWLMRAPDAWDSSLSPHIVRENQTVQSLKDALGLRNLIFKWFPEANRAELRMFRTDEEGQLELMMTGSVARDNEIYQRIPSIAMRAKLCGFDFNLTQGVFERPGFTY